ncbi:MAG: thymidylate synthase [Patescibacteria group bacterium]
MKKYLSLLEKVMEEGVDKPDRTGVGTRSYFGLQQRYDLSDGFPAVTTKKLFFNSVKAELLWFISGSRDIKDLHEMDCHIWDANVDADYWEDKKQFKTDAGRVYGVQWRDWKNPEGESVDQLKKAIETIKNNPHSRRNIVTAWNPGELDRQVLPPCHAFFQFYVAEGKLSLQMYQRSCDMFLGVPFNIASYSLLLHMVAQVTQLEVGEFVHTMGDAHIYQNHFKQVKEQLSREPKKLPKLKLNKKIKDINEFTMDDIKLVDYNHHPAIKAKMAV